MSKILGDGRLCQHGIDVTKVTCIHCFALAKRIKEYAEKETK